MTARREPPDDPPPPAGDPGEPGPGRLRPTSAASLTAWALIGLVLGWAVRPVAERVNGTAPLVSWAQPVTLALAAVVVGTTAWHTYRSVQLRRERLAAHATVNRLALGRAAAYVGALLAGGYAGYALSWLGLDAELAGQRILRACLTAIAGALVVATGLLLERACRVPVDEDES